MKFRYIYILGILLYFSCGEQTQKEETIEAQFNVNYNLLQKGAYIDSTLNMSMFLPSTWKSVLGDGLQQVQRSMQQVNRGGDVVALFADSATNNAMVLIDNTTIPDSVYTNLKQNYSSYYQAQGFEKSQLASFLHNSFYVDQYVFENAKTLNFKMVFNTKQENGEQNPCFEILYIINKNSLPASILKVESSIGTINKLQN